ncbi:MAG: MFS transporter [Salinivirgaceae bacterium]|nr:MFS transporter [Salinivirgaceae bacterium]
MEQQDTNTAKPKLWNSNYIKIWCANFMIFFSFMLLAPLLPLYLSETYQADKDTIGFVLSGYTLTALLFRPFSGFIVDSFPRKQVLLVCYFLFFALFAGYLVAGSLLMFAIVRTMHGAPFGATTVANSTVAIDVLHPDRRAEGIGYYGLSNNIATAIAPTVALCIFHVWHSYDALFALSLVCSGIGLAINSTLKMPEREQVKPQTPVSLDRFFLLKGWIEAIAQACYAFSYGVLSTYIAIYGKEELGITGGTGLFFMLLALGLIIARIAGSRPLREGEVIRNASFGVLISMFGYLLFAAVHNQIGYYGAALIIGFGNGHMFPAFQTMFVNLATNSQRGTANATQLTSWDIGVGAGVLIGGVLAEASGYHSAFWAAWIVNVVGVAILFLFARKHFIKNRLR